MSASGLALPAAIPDAPTNRRWSPFAIWRLFAYVVALLFALAWTIGFGKDVHWDAVNYHLYLGYSALNDRFATDFFAAGTPAYINPYAYVPLYVMDHIGMSALAIAVVLASFQATIFWLTYEIALIGGAGDRRRASFGFAILAMVFAALSPVLLQGLGSTMADITTGVLVLAGWLAIARSLRGSGSSLVYLAGVMCGAAAALKLSNAVFAMAAMPMLLFLPGTWRQRLPAIAIYCAVTGATFVLISLPWSWRLWQEFGNPLFPFFNDRFGSPEFTSASIHYERFRMGSWLDFFTRPFEMLSVRTMVHTEPRAPDLRFAAVFIALLAAAGYWWFTSQSPDRRPDDQSDEERASRRVLVGLSVGLIVAWCLWLVLAGNSRYFLPMGCIAGAVLALVLQRFHRRWQDTAMLVTALLVSVQFGQIAMGSDWKREGGLAWTGPWLNTEFSPRFRSEPHLYLSTSFLSGSAFLPYWHRNSGMINITGFYALGPGRPGGARVQGLIQRNIDHVRLLTMLPRGIVGLKDLPGPPGDLNIYVRRFGLGVDPNDCEIVRLEGNLRGTARRDIAPPRWTSFLTCRLVRDDAAAASYAKEVVEVDAIFDRVEATCPNLFHPARPTTEQLPKWVRTYNMGSEMQLWIEAGRVLYFAPVYGGDPIDIGTVADWSQGPQPIDCSRKSAPAFGGILQ